MTDIFISYSSKDKNVAHKVCAKLEESGLKCWMAPRDINPGEEYAAGIMRGIGGCKCMVLIFSDNSNQSRHVLSEIESAFSKSKIIIPFRISDVMPSDSMEYFLKVAHWLDANSASLDVAIGQLTITLAKLLEQDIPDVPKTPLVDVKPQKPWTKIGTALGVVLACILGLIYTFSSPTPPIDMCVENFESLVKQNNRLLDDASRENLSSVKEFSCLLPNREINVKAWLEPERSQFMEGDKISFKVSLDKDAFLAVYVHSLDGNSYLLYPNKYAAPEKIINNSVFTVGQKGPFELEIAEPFGIDVVHFIATTDQQEFEKLLTKHQVLNGTDISMAKRGVIISEMQGIGARGVKVVAANDSSAQAGSSKQTGASNKKLWGEALILLNTHPAK